MSRLRDQGAVTITITGKKRYQCSRSTRASFPFRGFALLSCRFELDVCLLRQKQEQGSVGPVPTSRVHCIIHKAFSLSHSRGTSQARATSPCHNACCIFQWRSNFVSGVSPLSIFAQQSRYPPRLTLYLFSGLRREPDEDRLLQ